MLIGPFQGVIHVASDVPRFSAVHKNINVLIHLNPLVRYAINKIMSANNPSANSGLQTASQCKS